MTTFMADHKQTPHKGPLEEDIRDKDQRGKLRGPDGEEQERDQEEKIQKCIVKGGRGLSLEAMGRNHLFDLHQIRKLGFGGLKGRFGVC